MFVAASVVTVRLMFLSGDTLVADRSADESCDDGDEADMMIAYTAAQRLLDTSSFKGISQSGDFSCSIFGRTVCIELVVS